MPSKVGKFKIKIKIKMLKTMKKLVKKFEHALIVSFEQMPRATYNVMVNKDDLNKF